MNWGEGREVRITVREVRPEGYRIALLSCSSQYRGFIKKTNTYIYDNFVTKRTWLLMLNRISSKKSLVFHFFPNVFSSASKNRDYARRKGERFGGGEHYCVIPAWHLLSPSSFLMEAFQKRNLAQGGGQNTWTNDDSTWLEVRRALLKTPSTFWAS